MDQEGIRRKIESLLALAGSDNEHEALAAMEAARKLMLKYHISMSERGGEKWAAESGESRYALSQVKVKRLGFKSIGLKRHHLMLASVLAKNFRCKVFYRHRESGGICFVGFEEDAGAVLMLMEYLVLFMEQGVARFLGSRGYGDVKEQEISWRDGFCLGVKKALDEQTRSDSRYEIMLTIPQEVEEEYKKLNLRRNPFIWQREQTGFDRNAFSRGEDSGKRAVDERSLPPRT